MQWSNKYIGIPYKEAGRTKSGCDCYGLAKIIYKNELNIDLPDYSEVQYREISDIELKQAMMNTLQNFIKLEANKHTKKDFFEVKIDNIEPLDLLLFKMRGYIIHIGVYVGDGYMIHCFNGIDSAIEKIEPKWSNRLCKIYRHDSTSSVHKESIK